METTNNRHPVLFVGAGPGDPELITVKGRRALEAADVIIYAGSLVPEAVLQWVRADAAVFNSASMHLEEIITEIESAHKQGKRVVRLHTGDPSLYGAIFEQMAELQQRDITYQIIPGVTAAFAAAASLGIEYTLPELSQTLILTRMAGRTPVPASENLESLAQHNASMAIYLSVGMIEDVMQILQNAYGQDAVGAVVYRASQPDQKIIVAPLKDLAKEVRKANIKKQALIIVGKSVGIRKQDITYKSKLYDQAFSHGCRKEI
ncbi:MAG: precorrin-4 C(11)-methyltransferase [Desulfobacterales bacterium]|nr:precorrin-4 C(11)-methyltransferase [Desulfobacterales bacterium]